MPDLDRLHDDALVDCAIDHLRTRAAEPVDDEIVETARHSGRFVRAVGRTSGALGVAAILAPRGARTFAEARAEVAALKPALGARIVSLVYRQVDAGDGPLVPERLAEGALA